MRRVSRRAWDAEWRVYVHPLARVWLVFRNAGEALAWLRGAARRGRGVMAVAEPVVWKGNVEESQALVAAIARNCACETGLMGVRTSTCPPHQALLDNQRWLDGLLWMRHLADRLRAEEQTGIDEPTDEPLKGMA